MITIKLTKSDGMWRADIEELPGSPRVGIGDTKRKAIAHLFLCLIIDDSPLGLKIIRREISKSEAGKEFIIVED